MLYLADCEPSRFVKENPPPHQKRVIFQCSCHHLLSLSLVLCSHLFNLSPPLIFLLFYA